MAETIEEITAKLEALTVENERLEVSIAEMGRQNTRLRQELAGHDALIEGMHAVVAQRATDAVAAEAAARSILANTHEIDTLRKKVGIQTHENKILRECFDLLSAKNEKLKSKCARLQQDVRSLESDINALQSVAIVRKAMQTLEYFICSDAAINAGKSAIQIRKLRLSTFERLTMHSISPPSWATEELVAMIEHYKTDAATVANLPCSEEGLLAALHDDDDDDDDRALKADSVRRLTDYYRTKGVAFGTWMHRR